VSLEAIVRSLRAMGVACTVMESGADGALLVTPECGRVLGLWPHWRGENALWTDPNFPGSLAIGAKDDSWTCPGGDRMVLAPAGEFLDDGRSPPAIDPGSWEVQPEKGAFVMENRGDALAWKTGVRIGFRIRRRIRPLAEPEMGERWGVTWMRRAGYEEQAALSLQSGSLPGAALWNAVRVRGGGETSAALSPGGERCRIVHLEELDAGRALLLVREVETGGPGPRSGGEISCLSPGVGEAGRSPPDRVSWTLWLAAFSGRLSEARGLAERLAAPA
jgi:hypothetical protein